MSEYENLTLKGRGSDHVTNFEILGPLYIFGTVVVTNCVFGTACISHRMTDYPNAGVVRSRDLILQYNVNVGNKKANINVKKLVSLKHGVSLGSVCPAVKSSPLTPKHSIMGQISLQFCIGVNRKRPLWLMFFQQHRQRRCCANKVRLECERVFSARLSDLM